MTGGGTPGGGLRLTNNVVGCHVDDVAIGDRVRLHGFGHVHEACSSSGAALTRARSPGAEVAVVANGGGPVAGVLLLTAERR